MASTMKRSKLAVIICGSLVAAIILAYFVFFYPPQSEQDVRGTIGGVKKYRSEQIGEKDVQVGEQGSSQTSGSTQNQGPDMSASQTASQTAAASQTASQTAGASQTAKDPR